MIDRRVALMLAAVALSLWPVPAAAAESTPDLVARGKYVFGGKSLTGGSEAPSCRPATILPACFARMMSEIPLPINVDAGIKSQYHQPPPCKLYRPTRIEITTKETGAPRTAELMPPAPSVTEGTTRHLGAEAPTQTFDSLSGEEKPS